ncbi:MAG: polymorphic toxin-type HINT domain-containing protein, partial [Clostridia bacterium]|nr:polymorphic toxin-type HINT domain-containing protein [Clostridia bacterium]
DYFYDGTAVLYTKNESGETTSFNLVGTEDNILATARPGEDGKTDFYTYTKDLRESSINIVDKTGTSVRSYSYDDYGETKAMGSGDFYNEICYGAGIYDDTTGLYYLNARYYSPETGNFLTQDTYRGSRSKTETLNLYGYCAGNPINYTDPSGHWFWGVVGAAMGAHDGYKFAKKRKYKGWKKAAAIAGGAVLGAVNPFKVFKAAKTGYRAYKACKYAKRARSLVKGGKVLRKVRIKPRLTKIAKKKIRIKHKPKVIRSSKRTIGKIKRKAKAMCFVAGTKVHTEKGFKAIEKIKPGDRVWSEDTSNNSKALKKVKKIFVREKDSIVRLTINGEVIKTTNEHPFYVEGRGFVEAEKLKTGDKVRLEDGKIAIVESKELLHLEKPIKVYNFEVEDYHTYYVYEQKVLVHNTCAKPAAKKQISKSANSGSRPEEGIEIKLKYKDTWTPEQRAQAYEKVKALSESVTKKSSVGKRKNVRNMYKKAYGNNSIPENHDIDHIIDLQLGGTNELSNLRALDKSVNRSLGAQISRQIKGYDYGTVFGKFTIE